MEQGNFTPPGDVLIVRVGKTAGYFSLQSAIDSELKIPKAAACSTAFGVSRYFTSAPLTAQREKSAKTLAVPRHFQGTSCVHTKKEDQYGKTATSASTELSIFFADYTLHKRVWFGDKSITTVPLALMAAGFGAAELTVAR